MRKNTICCWSYFFPTTKKERNEKMKTAQLKQEISIVDVVEKYLGVSIPTGKTKFSMPCPIHSGDNENAFSVDATKGIAKCFTQCNEDAWDIIGLTQKIHNTDFEGAISLLEKDFLHGGANTLPQQKKVHREAATSTNAPKKYNKLYNTLSQDSYFLQRGLSSGVVEKYGLGAIPKDSEPTLLKGLGFDQKESYMYHRYRYIIPISNQFCIARLDESMIHEEDREQISRYYNPKGVTPELLNKQYIGDGSKTFIFVAEGVFDALSIETLGYDAIALNSTSNAPKLVQAIQNNEDATRKQQFILMPDSDEAGKKLAKKLQESFKNMNMSIYIAELDGQYKDINELLMNDPEQAEKTVNNAIDKCINANSAFNILIESFSDIEKVEPIQIKIFPDLNEFIGGLRAALYVIGAISSLGKTTFVQNIADHIAESGEHVLFFSLEMGKKELVAKSLVRTMQEMKFVHQAEGKITYTRDLLSGHVKDQAFLTEAIGRYGKTAKNVFIHEAMFGLNVKTIRQEIEKHIRFHKKKPLVVVDYLQILQPLNDRMSDKQATDVNVSELKRMTRDLDVPIFAISSFNRDSYNKGASFTSFKESGSIEYSSDVVMTLELRREDEDVSFDELKAKKVREIDLKILKNRFGPAYGKIGYKYLTETNIFVEAEDSSDDPAVKKETTKKRL